MSDFFQEECDPVKPIHNFSKGIFAFLLEWTHHSFFWSHQTFISFLHMYAGLCDSWLHTPNNHKVYYMQITEKIALTHKTQESKILEL